MEETKEIKMNSFKLTAKKVAELEKTTKKPFLQYVGFDTMEELAFFVSKGLDCSVEDAYSAIDEYCEKEGKDTNELQVDLIERLEKQGFLPKALKLSQKIQGTMNQVGDMSISQISGLMENQTQSSSELASTSTGN